MAKRKTGIKLARKGRMNRKGARIVSPVGTQRSLGSK